MEQIMNNETPNIETQTGTIMVRRISFSREERDILGKGSYGLVSRGKLKSISGRGTTVNVAVKRILKDPFIPREYMEREIGNMKSLSHRNVLELLHHEEDNDFLYLALELCQTSLKEYCSKGLEDKYYPMLRPPLDMLLQMAQGLDHIHSNNLVHRDIKPANIMISISGQQVVLKIADFGFSKETSSSGRYQQSSVEGTQIFKAPELLKGSKNEPRWQDVDVFALGCVFYCFLTTDASRAGAHPFGPINWGEMPLANKEKIKENIKNGNSDLSGLNDDRQKDLIEAMIREKIDPSTDCRPNIQQVIETIEQILNNEPGNSITITQSTSSVQLIANGTQHAATNGVPPPVLSPSVDLLPRHQLTENNEQPLNHEPRNSATLPPSSVPHITNGIHDAPTNGVSPPVTSPSVNLVHRDCYEGTREGYVYNCAFDETGRLACALEGRLALFKCESWAKTEVNRQTSKSVLILKWNGSQLAAGCVDGTVFVWNTTGNQVLILRSGRWNRSAIWCLNWSPQSANRLASGSSNGLIRIWDTNPPGQEVYKYKHRDKAIEIVWIDSQRLLSLSTDGVIKLCNLQPTPSTTTFSVANNPAIRSIGRMFWHPDAQKLVSCSKNGDLKVWKLNESSFDDNNLSSKSGFPCLCIDWSKNQSWIACGGPEYLNIWNSSLELVKGLPIAQDGRIIDVSFSPDEKYLAAFEEKPDQNDCRVVVWTTSDWTQIAEQKVPGKDGFFHCLAWNPSSTKLAVANRNRNVLLLLFSSTDAVGGS